MIDIVDNSATTATCGNHKVRQEFRGFDGKYDTGNAPKDIHVNPYVHHHSDTQLAQTDLYHHRKGRFEKRIDIATENTFVIVKQAHTGKGQPNPQYHNFKPSHEELKIKHEVANDEYQTKDSCYNAKRGNAVDPRLPVIVCCCAYGSHKLIGKTLRNVRKPSVQYGKAHRYHDCLYKSNDKVGRVAVGIAIRPQHIALKAFFEEFEDNERHTETQQNIE